MQVTSNYYLNGFRAASVSHHITRPTTLHFVPRHIQLKGDCRSIIRDSHKLRALGWAGLSAVRLSAFTSSVPPLHLLAYHCISKNDTCGVRTHALSEWRLEPPP